MRDARPHLERRRDGVESVERERVAPLQGVPEDLRGPRGRESERREWGALAKVPCLERSEVGGCARRSVELPPSQQFTHQRRAAPAVASFTARAGQRRSPARARPGPAHSRGRVSGQCGREPGRRSGAGAQCGAQYGAGSDVVCGRSVKAEGAGGVRVSVGVCERAR